MAVEFVQGNTACVKGALAAGCRSTQRYVVRWVALQRQRQCREGSPSESRQLHWWRGARDSADQLMGDRRVSACG